MLDFQNARAFEEEVGTWLGAHKIGNLDSSERLDWWVPGFYLDVKEKRQPLGRRWHLLPAVPEQFLFVIDELSVRRASQHSPHAYFVLRSVPTGQVFLARVDEMFSAERGRVNRVGSTGHAKGKWVIDLRNFRELTDPVNQLMPTILADQVSMPWKASHCVTALEVQTV
jgi:hypothetical protein